jgi:uncharacterized protein YndB with AHSA1/START domain
VTTTTHQEFVSSRVFDAPRELVWKAFTEADRLRHWWGPKGLTMLSCEIDLRPGGLFHYGMRTPDGHEMWGKWVFREIVPQERLVYVVSFSDARGGVTRHPMSATWPLEVLGTTSFADQGARTLVTNRGMPINATEEERKTFYSSFEGMTQGFNGTWDQLTAYLARN